MRTILKACLLAGCCLGILLDSVAQTPTNGSVSGTLTGKNGVPLAGVRVTAMAVSEPGAGEENAVLVSLAQTDSAGRYVLEDVPPGRYYISAGFLNLPTFYPGVTSRAAATIVEVRAAQDARPWTFRRRILLLLEVRSAAASRCPIFPGPRGWFFRAGLSTPQWVLRRWRSQ
jgi:hypothetical protein